MRAWVTLATFAFVLCVPDAAGASPSAKLVYLRGAGTESCPGEAELRKAVAVRLGYDPFFPTAQKTVVTEVSRADNGYRGRVRIVSDDGNVRGERELATKGDDCGELTTAIALAVSIALDDLDEPSPKEPPSPAAPPSAEPAPPPPPEPMPEKPTPREAPPAKPPSTPLELGAAIGPTIGVGTAPDAAPGAALALLLRWPKIMARLDLRAELPASAAIGTLGGRVATNVALATAAGCYRFGLPFACAGAGSGLVWSRTENITKPATDRALVIVALLRLGVDIPLGTRLFLEPFLDLGASLVPYRVDVDGVTAHEASPIWGVLGIYVGGKIL